MDNYDKNGIKELKDYLNAWVYKYGTPFTEINFVFDSGDPLQVSENKEAKVVYDQAFPWHDEPALDQHGNVVGIQTVYDPEKERNSRQESNSISACIYQNLKSELALAKNEKERSEILKQMRNFEMDLPVYYVTSWNDEYLSQCILAGPVSLDTAKEVMKEYAIERLHVLHPYEVVDRNVAIAVYEKEAAALPGDEVSDIISVSEDTVVISFCENEERISIVRHEIE